MSIKNKNIFFIFKNIFIVGILSIIILLFNSGNVVFASNLLSSINNQAIINNDGTVKIIQTWSYDDSNLSSGTEHFINVNIDYESYSDENEFISDYKVFRNNIPLEFVDNWDTSKSFNDKIGKYGVIQNNKDIELCFGISEYSINEFRVEYLVHNAIKQTTDGKKYLHWTFTPTDLSPQPTDLIATIETTDSLTIDKIYGFNYQGQVSFDDMNEKNKVTATMDTGYYSPNTTLNIFTLIKDDNNLLSNVILVNQSLQDKISEIFKGSDYDMSDFNEETLQVLNSSKSGSVMNNKDGFSIIMFIITGLISLIMFFFSALTPVIFLFAIWKVINLSNEQLAILKDIDKQEIKSFKDKQVYRRNEPDETINFAPILEMTIGVFNTRQNTLLYFISKWTSEDVFEYVSKSKKEVGKLFKKTKEVITFKINEENLDENASKLEQELFECFVWISRQSILTTEDLSKLKVEKIEKIFARHTKVYKKLLAADGYIQGEGKNARLTEKGIEVIHQHAGLKNYLRDFSIINERELIEVKLWDFYFHLAALYGMADTFKKQVELLPNLSENDKQIYNIYYGNTGNALLNKNIGKQVSRSYASHTTRSSGGGGSSSGGGGGGSSGGGSGGGTR